MFKKIGWLLQKVWDFIQKNPKLSILIIVALIAGYIYMTLEMLHMTSVPKFCQLCHPEKKSGPLSEVHTWSKNIHAARGVECLDCHGTPGVVGYMKAKMGGLKDIYGFVFKSTEHKMHILTMVATDPKYAAEIVPNEICLFCHTDSYNQKIRKERVMSIGYKFRKLDGVVNPGFRKSVGLRDILVENIKSDIDPNHKKHLTAGVNCVDCHLGVAHAGEYRNKVDLKRCADCHEKRKATISMADIKIGSGERAVTFSHKNHTAMISCTECHPGVFPMKKGSTKIAYADHTKDVFCYSCHNNKKAAFDCNKCHGSSMMPKGPLTYKVKGMSAVSFSHELHTGMFKCDECHTKIWQMKKGAKKMKMDDMYAGKSCGKCHNGTIAFETTQCDKCHK